MFWVFTSFVVFLTAFYVGLLAYIDQTNTVSCNARYHEQMSPLLFNETNLETKSNRFHLKWKCEERLPAPMYIDRWVHDERSINARDYVYVYPGARCNVVKIIETFQTEEEYFKELDCRVAFFLSENVNLLVHVGRLTLYDALKVILQEDHGPGADGKSAMFFHIDRRWQEKTSKYLGKIAFLLSNDSFPSCKC